MNTNSMRKKVAIIGSGLGGLSCGYILQRNGYDVTVFEKNAVLGGCLQCFRRKGAVFETGMHFIGSAAPGQTMDKMMQYLGLASDVHLSQLNPSAYDTVSLGGQRFEFPNGKEPFIEKMSSYFPREKDAIAHYYDIVNKIASASTLHSLTSESRDVAIDTEYQQRSMNDVMDELFKDTLLKNVLVGNLPLYSAELNKTPFSQHAFIMDFYNQSAFRVEGGSDAIAKSLVMSIERLGGQVITSAMVKRIVCDATHAIGVETIDEQLYGADYVISTVHPARTVEMLEDTNLIRPAFRSRIKSLPQTSGCFAVYVKFKDDMIPYMNTNYYGYRGDTPWNCEHYTASDWPKGFLYMHMCHKDKAKWAKSGVILSYMNMEDVAPWVGTHVGKRGDDYDAFKIQHAERLLDEVETHFQGFRATIDSYYTSTPLTYIDYTGTEGGSMYGVAKDITMGAVGRVPYRTKIPNVLLAGQNVNSHGMLGVLVGTIVTCSELVPSDIIYRQISNQFINE